MNVDELIKNLVETSDRVTYTETPSHDTLIYFGDGFKLEIVKYVTMININLFGKDNISMFWCDKIRASNFLGCTRFDLDYMGTYVGSLTLNNTKFDFLEDKE